MSIKAKDLGKNDSEIDEKVENFVENGEKNDKPVDREKKIALLCYVCYVSGPDVIILQTY